MTVDLSISERIAQSRREQGLPPIVADVGAIEHAARIIWEALDRKGRR